MSTRILEVLGKDHAITILYALDTCKTTTDLQESTDVPPASVYRRLNDLVEAGLVEEVGGKRNKEYRRIVSDIHIDLDGETINTNDESVSSQSEKSIQRQELEKYR